MGDKGLSSDVRKTVLEYDVNVFGTSNTSCNPTTAFETNLLERTPRNLLHIGNVWTLDITLQDITESVGVTVTQGSVTGTLKMALTGSTTSVVITAADGVIFVTTSNVVIGATTVVLANVNTATNSVTLASYQEPSIRTPVTAVSAFGAVDTEGAMNMLDTNNLNTAWRLIPNDYWMVPTGWNGDR